MHPALSIIAFTTLIQVRTPARLMGRVSAAVEVVMGTPQAVSIALGALLVTIFGFHVIFAIMAVVTAVAVAYLLVSLRGHLGRPRPVPEAAIPDDVTPAGVTTVADPLSEVPTSGLA